MRLIKKQGNRSYANEKSTQSPAAEGDIQRFQMCCVLVQRPTVNTAIACHRELHEIRKETQRWGRREGLCEEKGPPRSDDREHHVQQTYVIKKTKTKRERMKTRGGYFKNIGSKRVEAEGNTFDFGVAVSKVKHLRGFEGRSGGVENARCTPGNKEEGAPKL